MELKAAVVALGFWKCGGYSGLSFRLC